MDANPHRAVDLFHALLHLAKQAHIVVPGADRAQLLPGGREYRHGVGSEPGITVIEEWMPHRLVIQASRLGRRFTTLLMLKVATFMRLERRAWQCRCTARDGTAPGI
jgi:hypothetical protein